VSEQPESPVTPAADEPAAVIPDDATATSESAGAIAAPEPALPPAWTPPAPPQETSGASGVAASGVAAVAAVAADRPEVAVGAAFAGGLVLALILKRLAR